MAINEFEMKKTLEVLQKRVILGWINKIGDIVPMVLQREDGTRYRLNYQIDKQVVLQDAPDFIYSKIEDELKSYEIIKVENAITIWSVSSFVKVCLILASKYNTENFCEIINSIYDSMTKSSLISENSKLKLVDVEDYEISILGEIADSFQNAINPFGNRRAIVKRPYEYLSEVVVRFCNTLNEEGGAESVNVFLSNKNVLCEFYKRNEYWEYASKIYTDPNEIDFIEVHYRFSLWAERKILLTARRVRNGVDVEAGIDFGSGSVFSSDFEASLNETYQLLLDDTNRSVVEITDKITKNLAHTLFII